MVLLDQATKAVARSKLEVGQSVSAIPGLFDLTLVYNRGAAFGIFQDSGVVFVACALAVTAFIAVYIFRSKVLRGLVAVELSLIAAGAVGNCIDRVLFDGRVTDFIEAAFIDFPVFNVADIAVTLGCVLLILTLVRDIFRPQEGTPDAGGQDGGALEAAKSAEQEGDPVRDGACGEGRGGNELGVVRNGGVLGGRDE